MPPNSTFRVDLVDAYVGPRAETITHTSGTRERQINPTVVVVDGFSDNVETGDRMDILMDDLIDVFTAGVRQIGNAILEPTSVDPGELEASGAIYRAETIEFARTSIREGRS